MRCLHFCQNVNSPLRTSPYILRVFEKKLEDGKYAYAFFNLGEKAVHTQSFFEGEGGVIRDVWEKCDIAHANYIFFRMYPHTVRVLKTDTRLYLTMNLNY